MSRFALAALAALALTPFAAARGSAGGCQSGYSYSGVQNGAPRAGVSAAIRVDRPSSVAAGHVAAWVGVGGVALGPGGTSEWLQAGIASLPGGAARLYYEVRRPYAAGAHYVALARVGVDRTHRFAVTEIGEDVWVATIDGKRVSARVSLPGSHVFHPVATAESWDGGVAGVCNRYAFEFAKLSVRSASSRWQAFDASRVFHDAGYSLALHTGGFAATSR
jgi:hypothetical protein